LGSVVLGKLMTKMKKASALVLAAGLSLGMAGEACAQDSASEIATLRAQIQALSAKLDSLQAKEAADAATAAAAAAKPSPAPMAVAAPAPAPAAAPASGGATILAGKPSISSPDGRFTANLHGVMQFDAASYSQADVGPPATDLRRGAAAGDTNHARDLSSGSNFRRARIGIDGKAFGDWDYNILFEFGGAGEEDAGHVQEMWVQYSGFKPFHARIGAFSPSIGLEDQGSTNGQPFLERPAEADIARSMAGGDFREGAEVWAGGERWYGSVAVTGRTVGVVNSQATGVAQPFDSALGFIGRAAFVPFRGDDYMVHIGAHGSYVDKPADTTGPSAVDGSHPAGAYPITFQERPELRVDGTRLISTGAIDADHASTLGAEFAAQWKSLFLQSEYDHYTIQRRNPAAGVTDPDFNGYYVEATWMLTGEARRYNLNTFAFDAPAIDHPFSPLDGAWGAFELAARYSDINLNYHAGLLGTAPTADAVRGGDQRIASVGMNWYMNPVVRFMFEYQDVKIDRLSPNAATFATPTGAQIGQHYHALALRSQLAF
jgi:phosphate-selective porin OprO/OprP